MKSELGDIKHLIASINFNKEGAILKIGKAFPSFNVDSKQDGCPYIKHFKVLMLNSTLTDRYGIVMVMDVWF